MFEGDRGGAARLAAGKCRLCISIRVDNGETEAEEKRS